MANSKYYGSKGNSVISIQKQLNKLGANLDVDGIWGKKTEAAYNSYKNYLGTSDPSSTLNMMKYTPPTDKQIKSSAQQKADSEYDWQISQKKDSAAYDKYLLEQKKGEASNTYDSKEKALQKAYAKTRKKLAEDTLSRGMGRSSYAKDVQNEANLAQSSDTLALREELSNDIKNIDDKIGKIELELLQSTEKLSKKKQDAMLKTISDLQTERQNTITKVIEYNNSLALKLKKLSS